jgi:hypothetical protein
MDPLTALGLASNVSDLVGNAIKCGKTVYKLYKDGFTEDQEDLEAISGILDSVVTGLQKAPNNANARKSGTDPQIVKLLTESIKLCSELRDLVRKCKPDISGSWRAAGVAALRKLVHKSDIESLEKKLETCRINLIAVFSAATQ